MPPPDFDLCVTDRRAGPDFNNLISIPLSLRPKPTPADTLRVALFNARSECVYRPPPSRKNKLTDAMFHDAFPDLLDFCYNLSGKCIILGDMNVHFDS